MTQSPSEFPAWPFFGRDERQAVMDVLESGRVNYWTGGRGRKLEEAIARACDTDHAIVMANGSVTLDAILAVLDIGAGDEVIVTPRSFMASASSIALTGAVPVFADVDANSQNITVETVLPRITPKTKAIVAVHLAGWPCDMAGLRQLADAHGLHVIEDAAQAHGARLNGRPVGGLGHVASFSFCQDKIITTGGEGGAVTTDDEALWERLWSYKDHGKSYKKCQSQDHPPGYRWLHDSIGTNFRMTEMQAAIGLLQYEKLPGWIEARRRHAAVLDGAFRTISSLRTAEPPPGVEHAYYKYYVFVRPERLNEGWNRDRIMAEINARGVPCMTGGCPEMYLENAFSGLPTGASLAERLPVAKRLGAESLMLQVHPTLEPAHINRVVEVVSEVMEAAGSAG
ncbi:MAG: DegT/DnrJ/EryC1/StrS family aminotransferase [Geminicoccaceae bacterium]